MSVPINIAEYLLEATPAHAMGAAYLALRCGCGSRDITKGMMADAEGIELQGLLTLAEDTQKWPWPHVTMFIALRICRRENFASLEIVMEWKLSRDFVTRVALARRKSDALNHMMNSGKMTLAEMEKHFSNAVLIQLCTDATRGNSVLTGMYSDILYNLPNAFMHDIIQICVHDNKPDALRAFQEIYMPNISVLNTKELLIMINAYVKEVMDMVTAEFGNKLSEEFASHMRSRMHYLKWDEMP